VDEWETAMMLDDVYYGDFDEVPPGQDAEWRDREPPELEWDESDASMAVDDLVRKSRRYGRDYS
jgi:hypothetical protein